MERGQARDRGAGEPHGPRVAHPAREEWPSGFQVDPSDDPRRAEIQPGPVDRVVPADRHAAGREHDIVPPEECLERLPHLVRGIAHEPAVLHLAPRRPEEAGDRNGVAVEHAPGGKR